jgi:hypothetical protein
VIRISSTGAVTLQAHHELGQATHCSFTIPQRP